MRTKNQLHIRDALAEERAAIRELTLAAYAEYATIMAPAAWAGLQQALHAALDSSEPAERIVAERHGLLVGSVMLYQPSAQAYAGSIVAAESPELRLLAVAPAARGQGVGAALVGECVRRAERAGAAALGLHTSQSMQLAIRMYERMGFVRAPAGDFQPPGAELVMAYRRPLDRAGQSAAPALAEEN